MSIYLKYFLLWFPMLLLAIANGTLREFVFKKYSSDLAAHQLSTFTLCILFAVYISFVTRKFPPASESNALLLGLFWVCLTLLFEFGFGRYRGNSWSKLLHDYNIIEGRIWVLVPLWVLVAPWLFYRFRH